LTIQYKPQPPIAWTLASILSLASVALADETRPVPEIQPGVLKGYLTSEDLPDSVALLPPPPAVGSTAASVDLETARASLALRDTLRWKLAAMDADLRFPEAAGTFSCALGVAVDEQDTPHLYTMLRRILTDAGRATYAAKDKYRHARPFMLDEYPICTPDEEQELRTDGSYPFGHTAIGWAWALVLAEASPVQSKAIFSLAAWHSGRAASSATCTGRATWSRVVLSDRRRSLGCMQTLRSSTTSPRPRPN
jgi:acid phosphatase (class A)